MVMEIPSQLLLVLVTMLAVVMIAAYSIRLIMLERNTIILSAADATANQIILAIISTVREAYSLGKFSTNVIEVEQRLDINRNFKFKILKIDNQKYILRIEGFAIYIGNNKVTFIEYLLPFYSFPCDYGRNNTRIYYVETEGGCSVISVRVKYDPLSCVISVYLVPS